MSKQSEQILEEKLVAQLQKLGCRCVSFTDESGLLANLKTHLEKPNNITYSAMSHSLMTFLELIEGEKPSLLQRRKLGDRFL